MGFRVMGVKAGFQQLDISSIARVYRASKCRLIVLDWGGTLVTDTFKTNSLQAYAVSQGHAAHTAPSNELKLMLEALCADPRNVVFVVSGIDIWYNRYIGDYVSRRHCRQLYISSLIILYSFITRSL